MSIAFAAIAQHPPAPVEPGSEGGVAAQDEGFVRDRVERSRRGDAEAFGDLYEHFHERVFRYVLARVGWVAAEAEDIAAEAFIDAWRAIPSYRWTGAPFAGWLFAVVHNRIAQHHRTASRRPVTAADDSGARHAADPVDRTGDVLARLAVVNALAALPDDQRAVLELRFFGSLTTGEVARALGRTDAAIRQAQSRALRALRTVPGLQELFA